MARSSFPRHPTCRLAELPALHMVIYCDWNHGGIGGRRMLSDGRGNCPLNIRAFGGPSVVCLGACGLSAQ